MTRYISILLMLPLLLIAEDEVVESPKSRQPRFYEIQVDFRGHVWDVVMMRHSEECDCINPPSNEEDDQ